MVGNVKTIDKTISKLKNNGLVLEVMEGLQNYFLQNEI